MSSFGDINWEVVLGRGYMALRMWGDTSRSIH
jgi:hypothetical protein